METFENAVNHFSGDGKNGAFQKRYVTTHYPSSDSIAGAIGGSVSNRKNVRAETGDKNAYLDHRFSAPCVDGRKRCENASVDVKLFIRFRVNKSGGFQKRIAYRA